MSQSTSAAHYSALAEFRYQIRRFLRFSEDAARAAGYEPQQHQLLLALKSLSANESTIGTVAERLQIQHHSAVALVARAEERGLVRRERGAADRRQVFVRITPEGDAALRELAASHRAELRIAGPALLRVLDALVGDIQEDETGAKDANETTRREDDPP